MATVSENPVENGKVKKKKKRRKNEGKIGTEKIVDTEKGNETASTSFHTDDKMEQLISDFNYFSLQALRYRIGGKFSSERHLFLKKDPSNSCSLIVANIPPFIKPDALKRILAELGGGNPDEIIPQRGTGTGDEITEGYYTASARFKTEDAVEEALQRCEKIPCLCLSDMDVELVRYGITKSCRDYRSAFKTVAQLKESVESYMEEHDAKILEEKRKRKRMANVPDEEGWITVTKSHYKPAPPAIVVKNKDDLLKLSKKKKRVEENIAFYSFQLKQSKMERLEELRRKFAEDKKKLAIAKAARKFRPA